jgi:hypothetical protein
MSTSSFSRDVTAYNMETNYIVKMSSRQLIDKNGPNQIYIILVVGTTNRYSNKKKGMWR